MPEVRPIIWAVRNEKLQEVDNSDKQQHGYSFISISTNYSCDKSKKRKIKEINTKEDLKVQLEDTMENKTDIKPKVSLVPWDYYNIQYFGYLPLRVKMNNEDVK